MITYDKPFITQRADPYIIRHTDGIYYFTATVPEYDRIILRSASTLEGLQTAKELTIWTKHDTGAMGSHIWAPELHFVEGDWYIYFAAGGAEKVWEIRPYVLKLEGSDPMKNPWMELGQMQAAEGDEISFRSFSLDATTFEVKGIRYMVWAEKTILEPTLSSLFLAPMEYPTRLASAPILLTRPEYDWENVMYRVNEGPFVLQHEGHLYLTYSASGTGACYCMGMLDLKLGDDPMCQESWNKTAQPVYITDAKSEIYGPGHNCFTEDEEGNVIMVYHARTYEKIEGEPLNDPNRHTMLKKVSFMQDRPYFDQAYLFVHFREKRTPDGEQVYFGVSRDGFNWEEINDGMPILWSYEGDKGVRDHTVIRGKNGHFYIFATDLSLSYGMRGKYENSWANVSRHGSHFLVMWESEDLIHWSKQRMIELGKDELGCRWAPDIIYDKKDDSYLLHWSSPSKDTEYKKKAIYYSRTKDFIEFSEPKLLFEQEKSETIDSAMYEENGIYYLFVKSFPEPEGVILLKSNSITGPFERVYEFDEEMVRLGSKAYEAPTAFQTEDGSWCLFLDFFGCGAEGQGYVPFLAKSLASGSFKRADEAFSFPYGFKHGTVLTITTEEYTRLKAFKKLPSEY